MVILQNTNRTMLVIKLLNSPKLGYIEYRHETVMQECLKLAKCFFVVNKNISTFSFKILPF